MVNQSRNLVLGRLLQESLFVACSRGRKETAQKLGDFTLLGGTVGAPRDLSGFAPTGCLGAVSLRVSAFERKARDTVGEVAVTLRGRRTARCGWARAVVRRTRRRSDRG